MSVKTIGVLSDTHMPRMGKQLPESLLQELKGVDLIIHAGDINKDYVIYELEELAPVEAVAGNTDDDYLRGLFGTKKIITVGKIKIGIVHGDGTRGTTLERARAAFTDEAVDCIVFGHSHVPFQDVVDGILMFNPGSPTDKRRQDKYSYGILKVTEERIGGEINYFE